jgi:holo-[acyl-carrier protein] synthase
VIVGIGIDVVDVARFDRAVTRTPRLIERLFAESERSLPRHSLAARFAAKEALVKAIGRFGEMSWPEMEVVTDGDGNPSFDLHGHAAALVSDRGIDAIHVSLTHDAGVACAFVVAERLAAAGSSAAAAVAAAAPAAAAPAAAAAVAAAAHDAGQEPGAGRVML